MSFAQLTDWLPDWLGGPGLAVAIVLPLLGAAAAVGLARLLAGKDLGARLAGAGPAAGFILAYAVVVGSRGVPVPFADHKALALALVGVVVGILLDTEGWAGRRQRAVVIAIGVALLGWVVAHAVLRTDPGPQRNLIVAYAAAAILVFVRTTKVGGSAGTMPVQLVVAAIGVAALAWLAEATQVMHLAMALAAAGLGFVAWNWPAVRFNPGPALVLGMATPLLALAGTLMLDRASSPAALAVLLLVFFSEWIAAKVHIGGGAKGMRPMVMAGSGLAVVVVAVLVAVWTAG